MAQKEISWKTRTPEGNKRQVYAERVGGEWRFFERAGRYEVWARLERPGLEDWLQVLDGVERRISRRLLRPEEADRVKSRIQEHFPEQKF